jgi:hypothetical protein
MYFYAQEPYKGPGGFSRIRNIDILMYISTIYKNKIYEQFIF